VEAVAVEVMEAVVAVDTVEAQMEDTGAEVAVEGSGEAETGGVGVGTMTMGLVAHEGVEEAVAVGVVTRPAVEAGTEAVHP